MLGMGVQGKAYENLCQPPECVINRPDASMWGKVEALGRTTGSYPVPEIISVTITGLGRDKARIFEQRNKSKPSQAQPRLTRLCLILLYLPLTGLPP